MSLNLVRTWVEYLTSGYYRISQFYGLISQPQKYNHFIAAGSKLQRDLVYILLLFRKGSVALVCDVAEMYLQVELVERDKKYVRFLWHDMDQSRSPDVYEFNRVVFGLTSSPFLAQFVIQTHAKKHGKDFPRAA